MKYIYSIFALFLSCTAFGQLTLADSNHCSTVTLYAALSSATPTDIGLYSDDSYSGVLPIGFTFNFYGTPNTQMIVGENGCICFDLALAGGYNPWPISAALLGNTNQLNTICGPWCDIDGAIAAQPIYYTLQGVAPHRSCAITWCGVYMFSCTTQWTTTQIILYETTNIAEVHITHKTICAGWNGGYAICGVQNAAGTLATVAPGRDFPSVWTGTNEAWRFTPSGATYTVGAIPFAPVPYGIPTVYWYDSLTGAYIGTGDSITVTPSVPTTYKAGAKSCNDTVFAYIHVMPVGTGTAPVITATYTNPSQCGACDGSIKLHGLNPTNVDTVFSAFRGVARPTFFTNPMPDSTITLTGLCAGLYNYVYVKVGNCPSNQITETLTAPVLSISGITETNPTVCGKCNGSLTIHGLFPNQPVSVAYNYGGVPQPIVSGVTLPDSSFTLVNLCAGTYTSIAATIGLCTATGPATLITNPPPIVPTLRDSTILGCNGDQELFFNTTVPAGYTSYWNFGDGSGIDSSSNTSHIYADAPGYVGTYTVTLTYEEYNNAACQSTISTVINFNHPITAGYTSNVDTLCLGTPFLFTNTSTSLAVSNPVQYHWDFGDITTSNAINPSHTYGIGGIFHVNLTMTDAIGCSVSYGPDTLNVVSLKINTRIKDTSVCLTDSMTLFMDQTTFTPAFDSIGYSWSALIGSNYLGNVYAENPNFFSIGDYEYMVIGTTYPYQCFDTSFETIHSYAPITLINLTASQTVTYGSSIQLNADGATYYTWTPDNGTLNNANINNPIATPVDASTTYVVSGMNQYGCLSTAQITINVDFSMEDQTPSAFTPNNDGLNDVFKLTNLKYQKIVEFSVYNRWGQKVFTTNNGEQGWDGTFNGIPQDMGVYQYVVIVAHPDGTNKVYKGDVTLIR